MAVSRSRSASRSVSVTPLLNTPSNRTAPDEIPPKARPPAMEKWDAELDRPVSVIRLAVDRFPWALRVGIADCEGQKMALTKCLEARFSRKRGG